MSHFEVLKKLFPCRDMTGELDNDFSIEGKYMDQVDSTAGQLALEFYPNTSTQLLSDWERVYDTTASGTSARQAAVETAMRVLVNKDGRLNPSYYVTLANSLGYDSTVYEGANMFVVASTCPTSLPVPGPATILPGQVYEATALWTWHIDSTGSTVPNDRTGMINLITERSPAFTKILFNWAP